MPHKYNVNKKQKQQHRDAFHDETRKRRGACSVLFFGNASWQCRRCRSTAPSCTSSKTIIASQNHNLPISFSLLLSLAAVQCNATNAMDALCNHNDGLFVVVVFLLQDFGAMAGEIAGARWIQNFVPS